MPQCQGTLLVHMRGCCGHRIKGGSKASDNFVRVAWGEDRCLAAPRVAGMLLIYPCGQASQDRFRPSISPTPK